MWSADRHGVMESCKTKRNSVNFSSAALHDEENTENSQQGTHFRNLICSDRQGTSSHWNQRWAYKAQTGKRWAMTALLLWSWRTLSLRNCITYSVRWRTTASITSCHGSPAAVRSRFIINRNSKKKSFKGKYARVCFLVLVNRDRHATLSGKVTNAPYKLIFLCFFFRWFCMTRYASFQVIQQYFLPLSACLLILSVLVLTFAISQASIKYLRFRPDQLGYVTA